MDAVRYWNAAVAGWWAQSRPPAARDGSRDGTLTDPTPSRRRALEALAGGGSVLDVGCGVGQSSLSLALGTGTPGGSAEHVVGAAPGGSVELVVGVDSWDHLLARFAVRADRLGVPHAEVRGMWPAVAAAVPMADVVVCHHVLYYVDDLTPFVRALTMRARRRVVVEIPAVHPHVWMRPLWLRLHGTSTPSGPELGDALAALREGGLRVHVERWTDSRDPWAGQEASMVGHLCDRLALSAGRAPELRALLREFGLPPRSREMATLWWP